MPLYKAVPNPDENVLRKHVEFFDRNNDGIVYPWETYQGLRAIGVGVVLSVVLAIFINVSLSSATRPGKRFSILFPLEVANVHLGKHGSDTGAFDAKGRFVPWAFEAIFAKHANTDPDYLTSDELLELLKANRDPKDIKGWIGAWIEWKILFLVGKDSRGVLRKETMRKLYDGSLFAELEKERAYK